MSRLATSDEGSTADPPSLRPRTAAMDACGAGAPPRKRRRRRRSERAATRPVSDFGERLRLQCKRWENRDAPWAWVAEGRLQAAVDAVVVDGGEVLQPAGRAAFIRTAAAESRQVELQRELGHGEGLERLLLGEQVLELLQARRWPSQQAPAVPSPS